jgi:hypothetical protein
VSTDLKFDAERDLRDLHVAPEIKVFPKGAGALPTGNLDKVRTLNPESRNLNPKP